jgi:hypothetical protein
LHFLEVKDDVQICGRFSLLFVGEGDNPLIGLSAMKPTVNALIGEGMSKAEEKAAKKAQAAANKARREAEKAAKKAAKKDRTATVWRPTASDL